MRHTNLSRLLEVKLSGVDLEQHIRDQRKDGADWRKIAAQLRAMTGCYVSHETVRSWFLDDLESVQS